MNPKMNAAVTVLHRVGRGIALYGVVAVLLLIGGLKFTAAEIAALENLIPPTPWLAWLYPVFGKAGASYLLGVVEIIAGLLLAISPWSSLAKAAGGLLASLIFIVTSSLLLALPVGEPSAGGLPALNGLGQFLIKDVVLLGVALSVAADGLADLTRESHTRAAS
jgi:uncharacterized membrane protein YkgB